MEFLRVAGFDTSLDRIGDVQLFEIMKNTDFIIEKVREKFRGSEHHKS